MCCYFNGQAFWFSGIHSLNEEADCKLSNDMREEGLARARMHRHAHQCDLFVRVYTTDPVFLTCLGTPHS